MIVKFVLGDCIVAWRAWILWDRNITVRVLLCVCLLGSFGNYFLEFFHREPGERIDVKFTFIVAAVVDGTLTVIGEVRGQRERSGVQTLVLTFPLFFTNIVSTSLVALKAW